ncbi:phosphoserine phosphatase 1 [Peptococcaceae bacterium CEB3]|nr:phosphoserine phosphatase 1 [Peptococcaceae bacterium CEB3]
MTRIILTRHGETLWNLEKRVQGSMDSPLSPTGVWQAQRLALRLRDEGIQRLYASDAPRARATAEEIRRELGLSEIIETPYLREFSFGEWEGKVWDELRSAQPDVFAVWDTEPHRVRVPGGETMQGVSDRAWAFLEKVIEWHRGETVCLVSHGLTVKLLMTRAAGFAVHEWSKTPWQFNTAVNILELREGILCPVVTADGHHLKLT